MSLMMILLNRSIILKFKNKDLVVIKNLQMILKWKNIKMLIFFSIKDKVLMIMIMIGITLRKIKQIKHLSRHNKTKKNINLLRNNSMK